MVAHGIADGPLGSCHREILGNRPTRFCNLVGFGDASCYSIARVGLFCRPRIHFLCQWEMSMKDRSVTGGVVIAIGLLLILLLFVLGLGAYFMIGRQQMVLAAEAARAAELQARMEAERARAQAEDALTSRTASDDEVTSTGDRDSVRAAVESNLRAQAEAWNEGDIDAFMEHYWNSDELTFSSGGSTTRGWEATLNRYRERYPTREQMGQLTFDGLEITPLGDSAALVLGQWNLERESEPVSGNFSLVVRKFGDRWLIIHDHTSRMSD
jgi:beta-aspartyl-peptidase (threonine type)